MPSPVSAKLRMSPLLPPREYGRHIAVSLYSSRCSHVYYSIGLMTLSSTLLLFPATSGVANAL
jgi:hypothetical protein